MDYIAEIKEIGKPNILTPSIHCQDELTKEELITFWGLDQEDVEWYHLYQLVGGEKIEI